MTRQTVSETGHPVKCSVSWCEKSVKTRGWCQMHYFRWRRGGDMDKPEPFRNPEGVCTIDNCDLGAAGRYCPKHRARLERNGDPLKLKGSVPRWGSANPNWRGNDIGYGTAHDRVRRLRGQATNCACGVEGANYQWALDKTSPRIHVCRVEGLPFSPDPHDYVSMCIPCHKTYDLTFAA